MLDLTWTTNTNMRSISADSDKRLDKLTYEFQQEISWI